MHVLDQEAPGLAGRLKSLPPEARREVVARGCQLAAGRLADLGPEVRDLLGAISASGALSDAQVAEAGALAEAADGRYSELQEEGAPEQEWLAWFSKARLLTAISAGFGGADWGDAADAVYELCSTSDDPSELIALVESEVARLQPKGG